MPCRLSGYPSALYDLMLSGWSSVSFQVVLHRHPHHGVGAPHLSCHVHVLMRGRGIPARVVVDESTAEA